MGGHLRAWYDAAQAVAEGPVIQGDKTDEGRTKQYNDGHIPDLVEVGAGPGGKDRLKEIKCFSALKKSWRAGKGSTKHGGCAISIGHTHAFGNTEEHARWENLGCKERGRPADGPLNHTTGKGWVPAHCGFYHDALFTKRNEVDVILHENLGGGFAPPSVAAMYKYSKKARLGLDRTKYTSRRPISFMTHHTQRISLAVVKAEGAAMHQEIGRCKANQARACRA